MSLAVLAANYFLLLGSSQASSFDEIPNQSIQILTAAGPQCQASSDFFRMMKVAQCEVIAVNGFKVLQKGRLTPLWAQEYIGADLAKEELTQRSAKKADAFTVPVGIVDALMSGGVLKPYLCRLPKVPPSIQERKSLSHSHGNPVAKLFVDPVFGAAGRACISVLGEAIFAETDGKSHLNGGLEDLSHSDAKVINFSLRFGSSSAAAKVEKLTDEGKFVVTAAGNSFPDYADVDSEMGKTIIVGSLAPDGLISSMSSEFEKVTILAPSDHFILSDKDEVFGATSGAAPLVSGAIANVLSILPDIKLEEMKRLIQQTAIPTFTQTIGKSEKNGAGMLNAYKLVRVAECLKDKRPEKGKHNCFNFEQEAQQRLENGKRLLKKPDCESRRMGLQELRASFLLSSNEAAALSLAEFYKGEGYTENAAFYSSFLSGWPNQKKYIDSLLKVPPSEVYYDPVGFVEVGGAALFSAVSRFRRDSQATEYIRAQIREQASSRDPSIRLEAVRRSFLGGPNTSDLLFSLLKDSNSQVRQEAERYKDLLSKLRRWKPATTNP